MTLQACLLENIAQARRYGDTETRRAERAQILDALNRLTVETTGKNFNQFCELSSADGYDSQQMIGCLYHILEDLQGICGFLRGSCDFPSKRVIEDLLLTLEKTAQFTEEVREWSGRRNQSSKLHVKELLQGVGRQLQYCCTQARFLGQLNGKWNIEAGIPDIDPIENLLGGLNELTALLCKLLGFLTETS